VLQDRLHDLGVEVNVKTFEEEHGIIRLGEDPFVSFINCRENLRFIKIDVRNCHHSVADHVQ